MSEAMTFDVDRSNSRQLRDWDGEHGSYWAEYADLYDRSVAGYHPEVLAAANAGPGRPDPGRRLRLRSGRDRPGPHGTGCARPGVDLSTAQLDVARRRGAGLAVEFAQADAQVHDFGTAAYDLIVSRTGTMFFGDAAAAFANLATATRPGGRLAILVWRGLAENQWLREIFEALRVGRDLPMPLPGAPGPFAQSDPATVEPLLAAAGWSDLAFEPLAQPIWLGRDADQGTRWQLGQSGWLLHGTNQAQRTAAAANLHALFAAHQTPDGVELGSAAWLITARRAP